MKRLKRWIGFLGILLFFLLLAGAMYSFRIIDISYEGNMTYEEDEMTQLLFDKPYSRNLFYCLWNAKYGEKKEIPFIEDYNIEFRSWNAITVEVYEKSLAGYVMYKDYNIYFDKDGKVVESSKERLDGVVQIEGLNMSRIILYEKLPVEDEDIFNLILTLTQMLKNYGIEVDRIIFQNNHYMALEVGDIRVELGDDSYLNEKIVNLASQLSGLAGERGTLYLNDYTTDMKNFRFKKSGE